MRELLKATYNFSDYQIAQLVFLAKTLLSEISKLFIIGLFFKDELPFFWENPLSLQNRALYDKMAPAREREAAK